MPRPRIVRGRRAPDGQHLGRDVATEHHQGMAAIAGVRRRPRGHRRALREAQEHQPLERMRGRDRLDDRVHVGEVVGDRQLAILARHPVRHDLAGGADVETVQALHRHEQPGVRAGQRLQLVEQVLRRAGRSHGSRPPRPAPALGPAAERGSGRASSRRWSGASRRPWIAQRIPTPREPAPGADRGRTVQFRLVFFPQRRLAARVAGLVLALLCHRACVSRTRRAPARRAAGHRRRSAASSSAQPSRSRQRGDTGRSAAQRRTREGALSRFAPRPGRYDGARQARRLQAADRARVDVRAGRSTLDTTSPWWLSSMIERLVIRTIPSHRSFRPRMPRWACSFPTAT